MRFFIVCFMIFNVFFQLFSGSFTVLKDSQNRDVRFAGDFSDDKVFIPKKYVEPKREMRGVWMATIENIDLNKADSVEAFKNDFISRLNRLMNLNINTLIFQVRPASDAFYQSKIHPWSRFLTGQEGRGISGFDPLAFVIDECHKRGIQLHAWLNPYRVVSKTKLSKSAYLNSLNYKNFARKNPHLVLEAPLENGERLLFLNPGAPQVIQHLKMTVAEIVNNYKVDAIHFDDYFYPYSEFGNIDSFTYKRYGKKMSLEDWRRNNVTTLVREIKNLIDAFEQRNKRKVEFGISPFGIWANRKSSPLGSLTGGSESYKKQHADTRLWVKQNLIDYVVPQIYWEFTHNVAAYAALAQWWNQQVQGTNVKLYIGLGAYRFGSNHAWNNKYELINQLRYDTKLPNIKGHILFSTRSLLFPTNAIMRDGVELIRRYCWKHKVKPF